ncbi:phosphatase PAP2 family protein [Pseudomonas japonica]|uniref:phosphatase PAP2 family protein n=1 Tax=Pseudomonas japonica TaxID=256466 RepID=UPI0015E2DAFA|nr:phosphatase PAP2 family protein [Pseudomonas japonica]MBA1243886.1 phosphatase PAP2 family protein [Pseudomonas japonica]MBA1288400.1 phosphatase PAP2 family protein [Pseudomonas japonica]
MTARYTRPLNWPLALGIPALLVFGLLLLEFTNLDMWLARLAYDSRARQFLGRHSAFLEDVLHDRAKQAVIVIGLLAVAAFLGSMVLARLKPWRRELGCVVLSMALSTSFVTPLKAVTEVQCPWSLTQFGGSETYSKVFESRPATDHPGRCWPGGHAATGFTLFALYFALRDRRPRLARAAFGVALGLGIVFSVGRMLQGAHFFSHNVWTAVFCWWICLGAYRLVLYRRPATRALAASLPTGS